MKLRSLLIATLLLLTGYVFTDHNVNAEKASYEYTATANKKVITTRDMNVYKVKVGANEASNKFKLFGTVKKGTYLHVSKWFMSTGGGYVIYNNSKYVPDDEHFYFIYAGQHSKWYISYTSSKMKAIKYKSAKEKVKDDAKEEREEQIEEQKQQDKQDDKVQKSKEFVSSHPMLDVQYQYAEDSAALNNVNYYHDSSHDIISEDYSPTDRKALLMAGIKPKNGTTWTVDGTNNKYYYLDDEHAKANYYDHAGWIEWDDYSKL